MGKEKERQWIHPENMKLEAVSSVRRLDKDGGSCDSPWANSQDRRAGGMSASEKVHRPGLL